MDDTLKKKIEYVLATLNNAYMTCSDRLYVGHSGGKDSCVVLHLMKQIDPEVKVVHTPKLQDKMLPETLEYFYYSMCQANVVYIVPFEHMDNFIIRNNLMMQIDGSRRDECDRTDRSDDFVKGGENVNRKDLPQFVEEGLFGVPQLYPIYDWTDDEVWRYIKENNIQVSKEYNV